MNKMQDLLRKVVATILAVTVMCAMLWFAYTMLITTPIFVGTLRIVLLICIGILTIATVYFFICKLLEIIALVRGPSEKDLKKQQEAAAAKEAAAKTE